MKKLLYLLTIVSLVFIFSCKKDDVNSFDDCHCGWIVAETGDYNHPHRFEVSNTCSGEDKWFNISLEDANTYLVGDYYCPLDAEPW